jgi:hypothetical protein
MRKRKFEKSRMAKNEKRRYSYCDPTPFLIILLKSLFFFNKWGSVLTATFY